MGMVKKEFVEYETGLESMEAGLEWMTKYGVKTFKDYTVNGLRFAVPEWPTSLIVNLRFILT